MTQSTLTNFKYQVDKTSLRNRRGVTVTFDYNGEQVKRILVFKEKQGVSYIESAKRVIEREYRNGQLEKYAKKYVRHNNKSGKSPVMPILVGTLAVAALALTGVVTYKAFTSSSGGGGGGDPTVNYYMVDFDTNGGSYTKSQKIESGKLATKPADPTKVIEGFEYKFDGWYDAKDGGNLWDFSATTITTDRTIYAHWTGTPPSPSKFCMVDFNTDGGSYVPSQKIEAGNKVTKPADPTKTESGFSYTFAGWYDSTGTAWDFDTRTVTGDTIIKAQWSGTPPTPTESYTVSFDTNGGSYIAPQKIEKGHLVTKPNPDPTKTVGDFSYTFDGWWDAKDGGNPWDFGTKTVSSDATIYAHWTGTPPTPTTYYTVNFNTQGGSFVESKQVEEGGKVTKPADPTKIEGDFEYTFAGWWDAQVGGTEWNFDERTITKNETIYAHWGEAPTYYTVTFDTQGGSHIDSETVEAGEYATEPITEPTKLGYKFDGWWDAQEGGSSWVFDSKPITGNTTIYAHWSDTQRPITFDYQNGTGTTQEVNVRVGEHLVAPDTPVYAGHTFNGWWTALTGGTKFDFTKVFTEEMLPDGKLYAQWTADPIVINVDPNGGTFEDDTTVVKRLLGFDTDATWGDVKTESAIDIKTMPEGATSFSYQYYDMLNHEWVAIPNDNFAITSDLSVKVVYAYDATSFENDSWDVFTNYLSGKTFSQISGEGSPYHKEFADNDGTFVGLTRKLKVNGETYDVIVIGENGQNGGGLLTFEFAESLDFKIPYSLDSEDNSYRNSYIHQFLNRSFYYNLPSSLQSAIQRTTVQIYEAPFERSTSISAKLFVLSAYEYGFGDTFPDGTSTSDEGDIPYSYYADPATAKQHRDKGSKYWTRSDDRTGSLETAWSVDIDGDLGENGQSIATDSADIYIAPVFKL